ASRRVEPPHAAVTVTFVPINEWRSHSVPRSVGRQGLILVETHADVIDLSRNPMQTNTASAGCCAERPTVLTYERGDLVGLGQDHLEEKATCCIEQYSVRLLPISNSSQRKVVEFGELLLREIAALPERLQLFA